MNKPFTRTYGGGQDFGDYFTDVVGIQGATLTNTTAALVSQAVGNANSGGILGVGLLARNRTLGTSPFPIIYQQLVAAGYTRSQAFRIYLNQLDAGQGSILFGGVDQNKYTGELVSLPVQSNVRWEVALTSISYQDESGVHSLTPNNYSTSAILDSGTTTTNIESAAVDQIYSRLGVDSVSRSVPCAYRTAANFSLIYGFGGADGPRISVPATELISKNPAPLNVTGSGHGMERCTFLVKTPTANTNDQIVLGDSFLRAAYAVFDPERLQIALAQARFNVTEENIIAIPPGTSASIPGVVRTASLMLPSSVTAPLSSGTADPLPRA